MTSESEWAEQCPDCGSDPNDDTLHKDGCRRIFVAGDPVQQVADEWRERHFDPVKQFVYVARVLAHNTPTITP